jgi:hypothetical protein
MAPVATIIASESQRALQRRCILHLLVTIRDIGGARAGLALAGDDLGDDIGLEHRCRRRQVETAGIAAHGIAGLVAPARRPRQWRCPDLGELLRDLALDVVVAHEAAAGGNELHVGRRIVETVETTVAADQPGGIDPPALIADRAAGDIELCALLRDDFRRRQRDGAAECRPLADGVGGVGEIAADFEQTALGIVALAGIAAGACGHENEIADVDPDILVDQHAAVAIHRGVPELVALDVDLHLVGRHRPQCALHARDIDHRTGRGEDALAGADGDLTALRHGERAVLEIDQATGDDFDARLVVAIGQQRQIVELSEGQRIQSRRGDQRVTLRIERGILGVQFRQDRS